MSQEAITIIDLRTGSSVAAVLLTELDEMRLIDVEVVWAPERLQALRRLRERGVTVLPQHAHWNWGLKAMRYGGLLTYRSLGVEAEGQMQGLMMVCLGGHLARLAPDAGKPLVYVDFVETAPWNATEFTDTPRFKGVGARLMQAAVRLSKAEGFSGRVGLHALAQASPFYAGACAMQALGPDPNWDNLDYFELTAQAAEEFLAR
jgi:hypothetical protein